MFSFKLIFTILCVLAYFRADYDKKTTARNFFKFVVSWAALAIWFI